MIRKTSVDTAEEPCEDSFVSYELARKQSWGFFDDVADSDWRRYQQRARDEPWYNPRKINNTALWLMLNVDPIFTCPHLRRVGGRGDGPKWTCDPHRLLNQPDCLIYSVGSKGVYVFEDGLIKMMGDKKKHCEIHVFDPDPRYSRHGDPEQKNIHYHAWGLKGAHDLVDPSKKNKQFANMTFLSIFDIMTRLGHTDRTVDVFKIDCEGCEVTSHQDWLSESVDIRQILLETHFGLKDTNVTAFFDRFLNRGFLPFSKEANTHPGARPTGQLFEWGFVRLHTDFLGPRSGGNVQAYG